MTTLYELETAVPGGSFDTSIPGILEFKVNRAGNSSPGSLTVIVAAVEDEDTAATKRFYPGLSLRIFDQDENMPFVGRIDTATLREDDRYGRVWDIKARDRLAILADNYVDIGKWNSSSPGRMTDHDNGDVWRPNYSGDWDDTGDIGEYRKFIIMDLCLNVIDDNTIGISDVLVTTAPNSKRIEANLDNTANILILDAIRKFANEDPWGAVAAEVDAKALADAGFPTGSGIGGELQMKYRTTSDAGTVAEYFQRGRVVPVTRRYRYGPGNPLDTAPIVSYSFDREGSDIFSRSRTTGAGEGTYRRDDNDNGTGVVLTDMESTWDPENGLFRMRREAPARFEGGVGDWTREDLSDEEDAIRARGLRDAAYAQLQAGAAGLKQYRGVNRGTIVIGGLPGPQPNLLRPGDLIRVIIPPQALEDDEGSDFVCEQWTYSYPEDQTTIEVTRRAYANLGEQLVEALRKSNDSQSASNAHWDSDWRSVDGTGTLSLKHSLGVIPRSVKVSAAIYTGDTIAGHKIPVRGTQVEVPTLHYDAAQGQNIGFAMTESTPYNVTLKFARWLSYSDGAGQWLKNNGAEVVVRVVLSP